MSKTSHLLLCSALLTGLSCLPAAADENPRPSDCELGMLYYDVTHCGIDLNYVDETNECTHIAANGVCYLGDLGYTIHTWGYTPCSDTVDLDQLPDDCTGHEMNIITLNDDDGNPINCLVDLSDYAPDVEEDPSLDYCWSGGLTPPDHIVHQYLQDNDPEFLACINDAHAILDVDLCMDVDGVL